MKKRLLYLLLFILPCVTLGMATETQHPLSSNQQQFVSQLATLITQQNQKVSKQRDDILKLQQKQSHLSFLQKHHIQDLAKSYHISDFDYKKPSNWTQLLKRADTIPASLALAQAINESAWGTSRFAKQGNNLYGTWCYTEGCGIVPLHRTGNTHFQVKRYTNIDDSLSDYYFNINTNSHYQALRDARYQDYLQGKTASGEELANYLIGYSTMGTKYVHSIQSIITTYQLDQWEQAQS